MPLRKSPMTPARLEANRRNAQKSTGPRTARGKSQSRLNSLRSGARSKLYQDLLLTLINAPPCAVAQTARAVLRPGQAVHPLFAQMVGIFLQTEHEVALHCQRLFADEDS